MHFNEKYNSFEKDMIDMYLSGMTLTEISNIIGCSLDTISRRLRKRGIEINNHKKAKINKSDVVSYYQTNQSLKKTCAKFNLSGGTVRSIIVNSLEKVNLRAKNWNKENDSKIVELYLSGLSAEEIGNMYGFCHTSILRHLQRLNVVKRKTSNKIYFGIPDQIFKRIEKSAINRGYDFNLTKRYLDTLFLKQQKKCAISGVDIYQPRDYTELSTGVGTASLDRIDSSKGYINGNVQWVHKTVNIMKGSMTDIELLNWCKLISSHSSLQ